MRAAAAHQAEAPGHGCLDPDPALAQTGDLSILLDARQDQNDDENGESDETDDDDHTTDTTAVRLNAGATQPHDGRVGRADLLGWVARGGDPAIVPVR